MILILNAIINKLKIDCINYELKKIFKYLKYLLFAYLNYSACYLVPNVSIMVEIYYIKY